MEIIFGILLELKEWAAKRDLWQAEFEGLLAQAVRMVKKGKMLCL